MRALELTERRIPAAFPRPGNLARLGTPRRRHERPDQGDTNDDGEQGDKEQCVAPTRPEPPPTGSGSRNVIPSSRGHPRLRGRRFRFVGMHNEGHGREAESAYPGYTTPFPLAVRLHHREALISMSASSSPVRHDPFDFFPYQRSLDLRLSCRRTPCSGRETLNDRCTFERALPPRVTRFFRNRTFPLDRIRNTALELPRSRFREHRRPHSATPPGCERRR